MSLQSVLLANRIVMLHNEAQKGRRQISDISKMMKQIAAMKKLKEQAYKRVHLLRNT